MTWNHSTHHHQRLHRLLPASGAAAPHVGCGDGSFAALLSRRYAQVVALDLDPLQVAEAAARCAHLPNVRVHERDFLWSDLPNAYVDVITALASWHHMAFGDASAEASRLLKPGGASWSWAYGRTARRAETLR